MQMTLNEWTRMYPEAAAALSGCFQMTDQGRSARSESFAQQQARFSVAEQGGLVWRNNVGATMTQCPECMERFRPVRYGLANESQQMNRKFKSSDLIGIMPVCIQPHHVGTVIGQFLSIETKRPGWKYSGNDHEAAQAAWLALVQSKGGVGLFSTGGVRL